MSMYKGTAEFTTDQKIFVVEAIMNACLDRIEATMPSSGITRAERAENIDATHAWENSALETAGVGIAIFYAQLTGDGLGITDMLDTPLVDGKSFRNFIEDYIKEAIRGKWEPKAGKPIHPDPHDYAVAFVEIIFGDDEEYEVSQRRYLSKAGNICPVEGCKADVSTDSVQTDGVNGHANCSCSSGHEWVDQWTLTGFELTEEEYLT